MFLDETVDNNTSVSIVKPNVKSDQKQAAIVKARLIYGKLVGSR